MDMSELVALRYPKENEDLVLVYDKLKKLKVDRDIYLVIDKFHLIDDELLELILIPNSNFDNCGLNVVLLMDYYNSSNLSNMIISNSVFYINRNVFTYDVDDIKQLMLNNNIELDHDKLTSIYNNTDGWLTAIQFTAINYKKSGSIDISEMLDSYMRKTIMSKYTDEQRKVFIYLSAFNDYHIDFALCISKNICKDVKTLVTEFPYVYFDEKTGRRRFLNFAKKALFKQFNELTIEERNAVRRLAANYYLDREEYFDAIKNFALCRDYHKIYSLEINISYLYKYVTNENKSYFLDIANQYLDTNCNGNYSFAMMLLPILLMYGEKDAMVAMSIAIDKDINNDDRMSNHRKQKTLATMEFVKSYICFNDFAKMLEHYKKSMDIMSNQLIVVYDSIPFTFGFPSALSVYHSKPGTLDDTVKLFDENMENYYRITSGHAKGVSDLLKAEALYQYGDFDGAYILCHKALYKAKTREQSSIIIAIYSCLQKIAIMQGKWETFKTWKGKIREETTLCNSRNPGYIDSVADIADSISQLLIGNPDEIASWLKHPWALENKVNLIALSQSFNIFAKYLFLKGNVEKFMSISGQMLGLADMYSFPYQKIQAYIYMAAAHLVFGDKNKATIFFKEAVMLAYKDNLYMLFVENFDDISILIDEYNTVDRSINEFLKKIKQIHSIVASNIKKCRKMAFSQHNYGLTQRESEIAKLVAKRYTNKQIGEMLFITEGTVKSALKIIFVKLGVKSRSEISDIFRME